MKKLSIPCSFGAQNHPVDFYVGQPKFDKHPIQNQSSWLSSARGGTVPGNVMQSLEKLHELSKTNRVNFAELCEYAINTAGTDDDAGDKRKRVTEPVADKKPALTQKPAPEPTPVEEPVLTQKSAPEPAPIDEPAIMQKPTSEPDSVEDPMLVKKSEPALDAKGEGDSGTVQGGSSFALSRNGNDKLDSKGGAKSGKSSSSHLTDQDIEDFLNS